MKLYTENQVRNALKDAMLRGMRRPSKYESIVDSMMDDLNPIELPCDEAIEQIADACHPYAEQIGGDIYVAYRAFKQGLQLMRDKIQGGNK